MTISLDNQLPATEDYVKDNWQELYKGYSKGWEGEGTHLPFNQSLLDYQTSWNKNNPNNQLTADGLYGVGMDNHFRSFQYPDSNTMANTSGEIVQNPLTGNSEEAQEPVEEAGSGLLGAAKKPWKFQGWDYNRFKGF